MLALAAVFVSAGFLSFPPGEEIGAMSAIAIGRGDRICVLHRGSKPLMVFRADGKFERSWGEGLFELAHGLRVAPDGSVWTTDNKNNKLRQFSPQGELLRTVEAGFRAPDDLVFASTGEIIVADAGNARLVKLSRGGEVISTWRRKGSGPGEFAAAHGLAIDSRDRIYVADRGNNRVQVFDLTERPWRSGPGLAIPSGCWSWARACSCPTAMRTASLSLRSIAARLKPNGGSANAFAAAPDGSRLPGPALRGRGLWQTCADLQTEINLKQSCDTSTR